MYRPFLPLAIMPVDLVCLVPPLEPGPFGWFECGYVIPSSVVRLAGFGRLPREMR